MAGLACVGMLSLFRNGTPAGLLAAAAPSTQHALAAHRAHYEQVQLQEAALSAAVQHAVDELQAGKAGWEG